MDRKTLPCLQNASQHVAIYLQQFPSYLKQNCQKKILLRTPAFISCVPWGRPCGNHAKRYMNENTIQCFPNPSQHVAIYLEQFLCFEIRKYKKSGFLRTAAHIFACRRPYDCSTLLDNLQMPARFGTSSPH